MIRITPIILLALALGGCEMKKLFNPTAGNNRPVSGIVIEYDKSIATYQIVWPSDIAASGRLAKIANSSDNRLLRDYQLVRETISIDDSGYFSIVIEHLEGDASIRMPIHIYNKIKNELPAFDANHDPIVKREISRGSLRAYGTSGAIIYDFPYNPEDYRFSIDEVERIREYIAGRDTSRVNSAEQRLSALRATALSLNQLNEEWVVYERELDVPNSPRVKIKQNLKTGLIATKAFINAEGRYSFVSKLSYKMINDFPVLEHSETYHLGDVDGHWRAMSLTVEHHDNINVYN